MTNDTYEIKTATRHIIFNGGKPLAGYPESWEWAKDWEKEANAWNEKLEPFPQWRWDCGFKLDFDCGLLRISSRFYPPSEQYGPGWDGNMKLMFGDQVLEEIEFEYPTLAELRRAAENKAEELIKMVRNYIVKGFKEGIIWRD